MDDNALSMSSIEADGREAYEAWQAQAERAEAHKRLNAWRSRRPAPPKAPQTTHEGEQAARERLYDEWVDCKVAIHLPEDVAERLLAERGWQPIAAGTCKAPAWRSPGGQTYISSAQALQVALIAENA